MVMKTISLISQIFLSLFLLILLIYWFSAYNSAFEADRACHSLLSTYPKTNSIGCDHDTETHQWILYENQENSAGASIIKRFRYRFL